MDGSTRCLFAFLGLPYTSDSEVDPQDEVETISNASSSDISELTLNESEDPSQASSVPSTPQYNGPDLLARLPVELRIMIFECVLKVSTPLIIEHSSEDIRLIDEGLETGCWDWIGILETCRQYQEEGLPILLANNKFLYVLESRVYETGALKRGTFIPGKWARFLKDLSIVHMNNTPTSAQFQLDAMNFMNLLQRNKVRLDRMFLCACSSTPRGIPLPLLIGAEIYVPCAMRFLAMGQLKQLYVGSFVPYVDDDYNLKIQDCCPVEVAMEATSDLFNQITTHGDTATQLTRFELLDKWLPTGSYLHLVPFQEPVPFSLQDRYSMFTTIKVPSTWRGRTLRVDEDSVIPEHAYLDWDLVRCESIFATPRNRTNRRTPALVYVGDEEARAEVELSYLDYQGLRAVQEWWPLYLAASRPGQQKITKYFSQLYTIDESS
jgi:hypothetical protein